MVAGENGGIKALRHTGWSYLQGTVFNIDTYIGGVNPFSTNFFSTKISTGIKYTETTYLLRQQYDLGKKDSIVTDSTVIPLFYPQLRFQHTIQYDKDQVYIPGLRGRLGILQDQLRHIAAQPDRYITFYGAMEDP